MGQSAPIEWVVRWCPAYVR